MLVGRIAIALFLAIAFILTGAVYAQDIQELELRIERLEQKAASTDILSGMDIGAGATFIIQGTHNANGANIGYKGNDKTDAAYSIEVTLEKELADNAKAFMSFETGEGNGVTDDLEVFSNVNHDADNSGGNPAVSQLWYEQEFEPGLIVTLGKLDATAYLDTNECANDETSQFLGSIFRNSPVIEFPANTIGLHLGTVLTDKLSLDMEILDGDGDFEQIGDGPFLGAQLNIKPKLFERSGNYRLIFWLNEAAHTKWNDASKTKEGTSGFGLSCDQEIRDNVGVFARAGWQEEEAFLNGEGEAFSLESAYSAGVQLGGNIWGRKDDVLAIAWGIVNPSQDYKQAGGLQAKNEGHFEIYYNFRASENLSITPDIQIITNPYGKDAANGSSTITVAGVRAQVEF